MLCALPEDGRLLDAGESFRHLPELLHDTAEVGAVVRRRGQLVELVEGRFHASPDDGYLGGERRALSLDRVPQRFESGGGIAGAVIPRLGLGLDVLPVVDRHATLSPSPRNRARATSTTDRVR